MTGWDAILREHFGLAQHKLRDRRISLRTGSVKGKNPMRLRINSAKNLVQGRLRQESSVWLRTVSWDSSSSKFI